MSESADRHKLAKKEAKAELKRQKKQHKLGTQPAVAERPAATPNAPSPPGISPAERSAAAAERQVRLQQHRVWLALATALIAILTLLATIRPWERFQQPTSANDETTTEEVGPAP